MKKLYASDMLTSSTPEQVSKLFQLDQATPEQWRPEDLRAMVRHQMSAPLEFDLGTVKLSQLEQKTAAESLTDAARSDIKSFGDLLSTDRPPLELLRLSQKFFKQNVASSSKGSPEQRIAYLFYLLSIVAARTRLKVKTSKLSDMELLNGIQSMVNRTWIDDRVRALLEDGRRRIATESSR
jgi:hypothetical protein